MSRRVPRLLALLSCAAWLFAWNVALAQDGAPTNAADEPANTAPQGSEPAPTNQDAPSSADAPTQAAKPSEQTSTDAASEPAKPSEPLPPSLAPQLSLSLTPASGLVVGDVLTLKIEAVVSQGVDVAIPDQSLAPFELLDRRARTETTDGKQRHVFELDLLPLEAGELTVPALRVRVVGPKGELGETSTASRTVRVASPLENEPNAEPKPPTDPRTVIQDDYTLAWVLGGLLAVAFIVLTTLLIQRWLAKRPKAAPPPPPPRPAWEVAFEKLEQLKRRKESLLASDQGAVFVEEVSAILREYLGKRYGFDGLESTTEEILSTLERLRPHKLSLSGVSLLLEQCDLVKFARATPDEAQCDDLWNGASGLVRATTPQPEPQAAPAAEVAR